MHGADDEPLQRDGRTNTLVMVMAVLATFKEVGVPGFVLLPPSLGPSDKAFRTITKWIRGFLMSTSGECRCLTRDARGSTTLLETDRFEM